MRPANDGALDFPVSFGLQLSAGRCSSGIAIVDEGYAVADEDVIFDHDPFADKSVTGNLAALANRGVLLNLDESTDLRLVAYFTSVEIDEFAPAGHCCPASHQPQCSCTSS